MSDIVTIGDAMLIHGDCLEVMAEVPECFAVDCVVTDPPYGIDGMKSGRWKDKSSKGDYDTDHFKDTKQNLLESVVPAILMARGISDRLVMTPGQTNIHKYPEPDHMGAFFYPASTSIS